MTNKFEEACKQRIKENGQLADAELGITKPSHNTEVEEIVNEFLKRTDPNNYEVKDYTNTLNDNGESLLDTTWYPESPYELNRDSIAGWLRTTLHQELQRVRQETIEEALALAPHFKNLNGDTVYEPIVDEYKARLSTLNKQSMQTQLPEKYHCEVGTAYTEDAPQNKINQLIDYLAEFTTVVEGKMNKGSSGGDGMVGSPLYEPTNEPLAIASTHPVHRGTSGTNQTIPTLKETLLGEIRGKERMFMKHAMYAPESERDRTYCNAGYNQALSDVEAIINRLIP